MKSTISLSDVPEKNIFVRGNLLINRSENKDKFRVVVADGRDTAISFSGIVVHTTYDEPLGELVPNWCKESFEQFHGTVTLSA